MRLFIAEKKELATAIATNLGVTKTNSNHYICNDDIVTWCYGHLLQLTDPEDYDDKFMKWNMMDLPLKWDIEFKENPKHSALIKFIGSQIKKADEIVNAGDPDEEGQFLIDELLVYFKNKKPVKRLLINDNTDELVKKSLNSMSDNEFFKPMYYSAMARAVADQRYGYNFTRAYTLYEQAKNPMNREVYSIGRVQTPILHLICNRFNLNKSHKKIDYFEIKSHFKQNQIEFTGKLQTDEKILDENEIKSIQDQLKDKSAKIIDIKKSKNKVSPELPFNLIALQIKANDLYGYTSDFTLEQTQNLRDKYKLITYNRSDSRYLSEERHEQASELLDIIGTNLNISNVIEKSNPSFKSKAFDSKKITAHHAIIPTLTKFDEKIKLTKAEFNIYQLIAYQYIIQFYPDYVYETTSVELKVGDLLFLARDKKVIDSGWKSIVATKNEEAEEDLNQIILDNLDKNKLVDLIDSEIEKKSTKPPALYTEARLLEELTNITKYIKDDNIKQLLIDKDKAKPNEHGGIGTPATRSTIIKNLKYRNFIEEDKNKKFVPTEKGLNFIQNLPDYIKQPDLTALWHEKQNEIRNNELNFEDFIFELEDSISKNIKEIKEEFKKYQFFCPKCNVLLRKIYSKKNKNFFWSCSNYPNCKQTFSDLNGKPDLSKIEEK